MDTIKRLAKIVIVLLISQVISKILCSIFIIFVVRYLRDVGFVKYYFLPLLQYYTEFCYISC